MGGGGLARALMMLSTVNLLLYFCNPPHTLLSTVICKCCRYPNQMVLITWEVLVECGQEELMLFAYLIDTFLRVLCCRDVSALTLCK